MSSGRIPRGSRWEHSRHLEDDGDRLESYGSDIFVVRPAVPARPLPAHVASRLAAPPGRVALVCPESGTSRCRTCTFDEVQTPPTFCPDHRVALVRVQS
ncbi:MAG: hypothetical protein ABSH20_32090 [Tepidisphaeraceae bacterium]